MRAICKLAMVALLLVGSYKIYAQYPSCTTPGYESCATACGNNQNQCMTSLHYS